jgi:glucose-1-phosphate cytidylyltransferase
LKRVLHHIGDDDVFAFTYGDGVANIDLDKQLAFHRAHGKLATVAAVRPLSRFGALTLDGDAVTGFQEKPEDEGGWINGGFFLLSPGVGGRIRDDATVWEREPIQSLARDNQLRAFIHEGFWQPMDTLRDKNILEDRWANGRAEWKTW